MSWSIRHTAEGFWQFLDQAARLRLHVKLLDDGPVVLVLDLRGKTAAVVTFSDGPEDSATVTLMDDECKASAALKIAGNRTLIAVSGGRS